MSKIRFGKSYQNIYQFKKNFTDDNEKFFNENKWIDEIYAKQPIREKCIVCGEVIGDTNKSFKSHEIQYYVCKTCGHINGKYIETKEFTSSVYVDSNHGEVLYESDEKEAYRHRVANIYTPKAEYLKEVIDADGDIDKMSLLDIGAGAGYFINACSAINIEAEGVEIDSNQVNIGRRLANDINLRCVCEDDIVKEILRSDKRIISFIGVLEHVINLHEILEAVYKNNTIKYVFFSVPMFSFSVIWEALFPEIFNRHLGGWHTHIFTNESVDYLCSRYSMQKVGVWRFGADSADLMRNIICKLRIDGNDHLAEVMQNNYIPILDKIQLNMDMIEFSSEVHVVAKIFR